jgi:hypothetical protein
MYIFAGIAFLLVIAMIKILVALSTGHSNVFFLVILAIAATALLAAVFGVYTVGGFDGIAWARLFPSKSNFNSCSGGYSEHARHWPRASLSHPIGWSESRGSVSGSNAPPWK